MRKPRRRRRALRVREQGHCRRHGSDDEDGRPNPPSLELSGVIAGSAQRLCRKMLMRPMLSSDFLPTDAWLSGLSAATSRWMIGRRMPGPQRTAPPASLWL